MGMIDGIIIIGGLGFMCYATLDIGITEIKTIYEDYKYNKGCIDLSSIRQGDGFEEVKNKIMLSRNLELSTYMTRLMGSKYIEIKDIRSIDSIYILVDEESNKLTHVTNRLHDIVNWNQLILNKQ